jgi:hypothetical protein
MIADCTRCPHSITAETPQSVVVLCQFTKPAVVVAVLPRKVRLERQTVTARECPQKECAIHAHCKE